MISFKAHFTWVDKCQIEFDIFLKSWQEFSLGDTNVSFESNSTVFFITICVYTAFAIFRKGI